jgi:2-polyprenyl-6-methoxyphenol hydroxylase-like FAD-dependent oxidoreductase
VGAGRHDVIVAGTRVAGAATAMLLARQGLRVLAADRASFPGDTISSHQLQVPGAALPQRWGLVGTLTAAGTPPARRVRSGAGGGLVLDGRFPAGEGVGALYSPRRTLLDAILAEAARQAGAEIRENFRVTQVTASGGRVTGIRGNARGRPAVTRDREPGDRGRREAVAGRRRGRRAPVPPAAGAVISPAIPAGPGFGSRVVSFTSGRAARWRPSPPTTSSPWSTRPRRSRSSRRRALTWTVITCAPPARAATWASASAAAAGPGGCAPLPGQPSTFRCSHGPGWALAGDAGVVMDPVSAQGMTSALRDASYLSRAVVAGLGGSRPPAGALHHHQRRRDRAIRGTCDFTLALAAFPPATPGQHHFLAAAAAGQQQTGRFLAAFAGIVPPQQYLTPGTVVRILGSRGIRKLTAATANHLFCGLRQRDPARQAGAGASRMPGWLPGERRCGR